MVSVMSSPTAVVGPLVAAVIVLLRWRLRDSTENIKVPMQQHKENIQTTIRFFFREIEFD